MTPADLLAGVLILFVVALLALRMLDHQRPGSARRVRIKVSLLPPSIDLEVERRSDRSRRER
jgi:hypothetical protein